MTVKLPRPHPAQRQVVRQARRWNVLACGRRWGKTKLGIDRIVQPAMDSYPVAWFSPTYKMLTEVWREAVHRLQPVTAHRSTQEHRLELITGGVIDMWSLDNPDAARGRKYKRAIVDEAAMIAGLEDAWRAVIRPTLTDFKGDGWLLSTPKGHNYFYQAFQKGRDPLDEAWAAWQMPTTANPFIDPAEVEAARHELPDRIFRQEYLAEFIDDAGGVFRRVTDAATAAAQEAHVSGHEYVFGVDWGKHNDFSVITVIDATTREAVKVDRFNQIDYTVQVGRLRALCERFRPRKIVAESNSMGDPLIEQLQRADMPVEAFQTTNATKASAIDALALAFERGDIRIINDPVLIGELQAYEMERLPSGRFRYGAPQGMHDDCVMSLALAWHAVTAPVLDYSRI